MFYSTKMLNSLKITSGLNHDVHDSSSVRKPNQLAAITEKPFISDKQK